MYWLKMIINIQIAMAPRLTSSAIVLDRKFQLQKTRHVFVTQHASAFFMYVHQWLETVLEGIKM